MGGGGGGVLLRYLSRGHYPLLYLGPLIGIYGCGGRLEGVL